LKVSGFTFARNAVKLQYPIVESIRSILPIVDEFVIAVGAGEDDTAGLIRSIGDAKIRIIESQWNPNLRDGGYVLAQQTNVALLNCTGEWAIYLQADEAIHERDHGRLVELMTQYRADDRVEGMLLQRISFFGDYGTVLNVHPFLNDLACRIVKPHRFVLSRGDAAGFTVHPKYKERGHRIRVVDTGLDVFHYCDVRPPAVSAQFQDEKNKYWTDEAKPSDYYQKVPRAFLAPFRGKHPASMRERIAAYDQPLDLTSPRWRSTLTASERRQQWRSRLIGLFGYAAGPGRTSRKIVASHRTVSRHPDIG
jgi:glycosyltransferase involved in cell wall biosynthesis